MAQQWLLTQGIRHEEASLGMGKRDKIDPFMCSFIHREISMYQELCQKLMLRKTI